MIYTLTFNPALDCIVCLSTLTAGAINRAVSETLHPGGKGINVSNVLTKLGVANIALGFVAGSVGDAIENGVRKMGIRSDFIRLSEGCSRINVKVRAQDETDINAPGPDIGAPEIARLYEKLDALQSGDILVLAGSVPDSLPANTYEMILARLKRNRQNVVCVIDAAGPLLLDTLCYRPFLIKPNHVELGELFQMRLHTDEQMEYYAKRLQRKGARNVLVSKGKDGAMLISEESFVYRCATCAVPEEGTGHTMGAGDSMLAGFLAGWHKTSDFDYALRLGTAAGTATAFCDGIASGEAMKEVLQQITREE